MLFLFQAARIPNQLPRITGDEQAVVAEQPRCQPRALWAQPADLQGWLHLQGLFHPLFGCSHPPRAFLLSFVLVAALTSATSKEIVPLRIPNWVLSPSTLYFWFMMWGLVMLWGLEPLPTALLSCTIPLSDLPFKPREIWGLYFSKLAACLTGLWKGLQNTVVISGRDSFCLCTHPLSFGESQGLTGSLYTFSTISTQRGGKIKHRGPRRLLPSNKAGNVIKNFNYDWHSWFCCCRRPACQNWQRKTP